MPLREADGAIRELAQVQFALFFHNLKAIQDLQRGNIVRADKEVTRIKALLHDKDREGADVLAKLEQATETLKVAEAEQQNVREECEKHEPLRALCQDNNFSDVVRLTLAQTEEALKRLDQKLEDAVKVTELARGEVTSCENTAEQCEQALDDLRQKLGTAEKLREWCKRTDKSLEGSQDRATALSLEPQFRHDDVV